MFRKTLTAALVLSQIVIPTAYAAGDQRYYYRFATDLHGGESQEGGEEEAQFAAFNVGGTYENVQAWTDKATLGIALRDTKTNVAYQNGSTWELASGSLPPGVTAKINAKTDTLSFEGYPTTQGVYPNIVFRIRDKDGSEVTSKPLSIEVGPRSPLRLAAFPAKDRQIVASDEDAGLTITAANLALGRPIADSGWKVEGVLPAGVAYGVDDIGLSFTGISPIAGTYSGIKVTGTDLSGSSASLDVSFKVIAPITTANSASTIEINAKTEAPTLVTSLRNTDDATPYTGGANWILKSGTLPPGIAATPSADGSTLTYSGYATEEGTFDNIVWIVTDTRGNKVLTDPVRFVVGPRQALTLAASPTPTPYLESGQNLDLVVSASNTAFHSPLQSGNFQVEGVLPDGITAFVSNGALHLTGSSSTDGVYGDIVVRATDTAGGTAVVELTITVNADLVTVNVGNSVQTLAQSSKPAAGGIIAKHARTGVEFTEGLTWTLVSGALPPGVTAQFNAAKSALSFVGYASQEGEWPNIVWEVVDTNGSKVKTRPVSFIVGPAEEFKLSSSETNVKADTVTGLQSDGGEFRVSATNAPNGQILAEGDWTVTGLPAGVTYRYVDGGLVFGGVPTKVGIYDTNVQATTASGSVATAQVRFNIENGLAEVGGDADQTLKQYTEAAALHHDIIVKKTGSPYTGGGLTWELDSGRLPPGIRAVPVSDGSGLDYVGYASESGHWNYLVQKVTDSNGNSFLTQRRSFNVTARDPFKLEANAEQRTMRINEPALGVTVTPVSPSNNQAIDPATWSVRGTLPPGINYAVDGVSLLFSGTPTVLGEFNDVVVSATDRSGESTSVTLSFVVQEQPPSDVVAETQPRIQTLSQFTSAATMKTRFFSGFWHSPYISDQTQYQLVSGSLPPGITAVTSASGIDYVGYPSEVGTWDNISWEVTDHLGRKMKTAPAYFSVTERLPLTLTADDANPVDRKTILGDVDLTITPTNLAGGIAIAASTWVVTGDLPPGVSHAAVNGKLHFSGVPTRTGSFDVKVQATDSKGGVGSVDIRFEIANGLSALNLNVPTGPISSTDESQTKTIVRVVGTTSNYRGAITWDLVSGTVPPGLTITDISPDSGFWYKGYPTQPGTYDNIVWKGTDGNGNSFLTKPLSFTVAAPASIKLVSDKGVAPTFDTANSGRIVVTAQDTAQDAGVPAANWLVSGALPDGVTIVGTAAGAIIDGVAKHVGTYPLTIMATDTAGTYGSIDLSLKVENGLQLKQTGGTNVTLAQWTQAFSGASSLVVAKTGVSYANPATTWSMISGALPTGITATVSSDKSNVQYSGVPTVSGSFANIVWRVTDANGNVLETQPLTIDVTPGGQLTLARTGTEDVRTVSGMPYDPAYIRITAANYGSGGISTANWTITGLPDGLTYSTTATYLNIIGTPKKAGSYAVKVAATDSLGQQDDIDFTITVVNGLSAARYNAVAETLYQYGAKPTTALYAIETAQNAPYYNGSLVWELVSGTLPAGLTLTPDADGSVLRFSGSATTVGTFGNIVFRVTDRNGNTFLTAPFSFTVNPEAALGLNASKTSIVSQMGTAVSSTITATNVRSGDTLTAANWAATGLPSGVSYSVNGNQLVISGAPTATGSSVIHITLTDGHGRTKSVDVALDIYGSAVAVYGPAGGGELSANNYAYRYETVLDAYVRLVDVDTRQPYLGTATWGPQLDYQWPVGVSSSLNAEGTILHITGTPTVISSGWLYPKWDVTLSDGKVLRVTAALLVSDKRAIGFTGAGNLSVFGGIAVQKNIVATNVAYGQQPTWTVTGLPSWASWHSDSAGLWIEGTPGPNNVGVSTVNFVAKDQANFTGSGSFTLTAKNHISVTNNIGAQSFTALTQNVSATVAIARDDVAGATTKNTPTWTLDSGTMPPGLTFGPHATNAGYMSFYGYATQTGTYNLTFRATDADGYTAVAATPVAITINARTALGWTTQSLPTTGKVGTAMSTGTFRPTGVAKGEITNWTVTGLPPNVSYAVSDYNGVKNGQILITGTPTVAGTYSVSITATEQGGGTVTVVKPLTISP
jgi:hypothetical protein